MATTLRALEPRDCAVLVRSHVEAVAMRHALSQLGVPAVATGRQSLFETAQAQELLTLLLALATPGDERRLRAALATRLFGFDAARLQAVAVEGEAMQRMQHDFAAWRLRWEQHGPQAMLADVLAQQATRLLAQVDGERQLTCLLQLGELLQEARASATQPRGLGPQGQVDWLRAAIANADKDDLEQQPRLESDAGRVQILTLHVSKGLEFPLVFLPFVAIGRQAKAPKMALYQLDGERVRQAPTRFRHGAEPAWQDACELHQAEERGEDMRLLYVGLTRAREALWLWGGAVSNHESSALEVLLGGMRPAAALQHDSAIRVEPARLPDRDDSARLPPSAPLRHSAATHRHAQAAPRLVDPQLQPAAPAETAWRACVARRSAGNRRASVAATPLAVFDAVDPRFRGERFGNAVHHALEHADFQAWRDHTDAAAPAGEREVLVRALESQDYAADSIADGVRELTRLVAATLNAPLPEGGRLCDLSRSARVAEIEFHFVLADADSAALLALLHAHGIALERRDFGAWPRLSGLMNGKIDLTYVSDGRIHVLDYKSNLLADYGAAHAGQRHARQRIRPPGAAVRGRTAPLAARAPRRRLRLRARLRWRALSVLPRTRRWRCIGDDHTRGIVAPRFDAALVDAVDTLLAPAGGRP